MKDCKTFANWLVLRQYGELDEADTAELAAHLAGCAKCRQTELEMQALFGKIGSVRPAEVPEQTLQALRNLVQARIRGKKIKAVRPGWSIFTFIKPSPVFQGAFAILLVAFGFLLGRQPVEQKPAMPAKPAYNLTELFTGNGTLQAENGAIDPYLANIEKVTFDPQNGTVELKYNTINDVSYKGTMDNPIVQELLRNAMMHEESTPAVRMRAVKTFQAIADKENLIDGNTIDALVYLLKKDQNEGVRLMALRVLKSVPFNEKIKQILIKTLLYDKNTALRIQAFETLTGREAPNTEMEPYLQAAKQDTSSYIRFKANEMLEKIKNRPRELSSEG